MAAATCLAFAAASTCFAAFNDSDTLPQKLDIPVAVEPAKHNPEGKLYCSINRDEFIKDLRKLQTHTNCTNKTCVDFIRLFGKYFGEDQVPTHNESFQTCDKKLKEAAGVNVLELHGCPTCNRHVYLPTSKETHCPHCGGGRYDTQGKPKEVCFHKSFLLYIKQICFV